MPLQTGARAALARKLISNRPSTSKKGTRILVDPEVLKLARHYCICSARGRGGINTIGQYLEDRIMDDVRSAREKELREKERVRSGP